MGLRTLFRKRKNAKHGVKYLERKLAALKENKASEEDVKVVQDRLAKKKERHDHWDALVKKETGEVTKGRY